MVVERVSWVKQWSVVTAVKLVWSRVRGAGRRSAVDYNHSSGIKSDRSPRAPWLIYLTWLILTRLCHLLSCLYYDCCCCISYKAMCYIKTNIQCICHWRFAVKPVISYKNEQEHRETTDLTQDLHKRWNFIIVNPIFYGGDDFLGNIWSYVSSIMNLSRRHWQPSRTDRQYECTSTFICVCYSHLPTCPIAPYPPSSPCCPSAGVFLHMSLLLLQDSSC